MRSTEIFAHTGKSLKDFIYESNKRKTAFLIETEEEAVNRQEERKITGNRQLVMEGTAIGSPLTK